MSELPELRESLVRAAERQYSGAGEPKVRRRRRAVARNLPAVLAGAVAIAVAVIAVTSLRAHSNNGRTPAAASPPASVADQQLKSILAVLRRPQTAYDRMMFRRSGLEGVRGGPFDVAVEPASARVATITPWGARVMLALASGKSSGGFTQGGLVVGYSHGVGGCCSTATSVEAGRVAWLDRWGRLFAGGSTGFRYYQVVPDGVSKVTFVIPRDPSPGEYGAPVYRRSLDVSVPVRGNIAAFEEAHRQCCDLMLPEIWYAADGRVIRRIGDLAAVNHVTPAPRPGPPTPQSLAAQRDPSTPNPVWVSPAVGGPHTSFTIHFRVLLNGAQYQYAFTGTQCPRVTFTGGTSKPNALRGSLWSDGVAAARGQALCAGTYHVAVSVFERGQRAKPFGSATFVVR